MGADAAVAIRLYRTADRTAVRHICHVTGYMGGPVDWLWRDNESFADLFTSYRRRAALRLGGGARRPLRRLPARLRRLPRGVEPGPDLRPPRPAAGIALRPGTAGVVWRSFADITRDTLHRRLPPAAVYDPRWPAHLPIDLLPAIRGRAVGAALVRRFLGTLRRARVPGCHLETLGENSAAIAFFETMGFRRHGERAPAPGLRSAGQRHTIQLMVNTWGANPAGRDR